METDVRLWRHLAWFFSEREMFRIEVVEKIKTHTLCSITLWRKSCRLWDNVEKYGRADRPQMAIWRMRTACCITKPTNTHSEYVILIVFALQQWLKERASMLRYAYIACHVTCVIVSVMLINVLNLFLNINQLDALNFIISLFQASTCFEHMRSSSGGKNCIIQHLVSSHWNKWMA